MALKPIGQLKRHSSDVIKPTGQLKRHSSDVTTESPSSKKKKKNDHRKILANITNSTKKSKNEFSSQTPPQKKLLIDALKNSGVIVRANSTGPEPNQASSLAKSVSLPGNSPNRCNSPISNGSVLDVQQTSRLGWRELLTAQNIAQKTLLDNNQHGFDCVKILKFGYPENPLSNIPDDLPFNFYSTFDAYTSKTDNFGIGSKSLANLWLFYMRHLIHTVIGDLFPNSLILHGIVRNGLLHESYRVRQLCNEYLHKLLYQVHPPRTKELRKKYLDLFFVKLPDQESIDFDASQGWETFSSLLEEYLSPPNGSNINVTSKISGNVMLVKYLVKLLEIDVQFWFERYVGEFNATLLFYLITVLDFMICNFHLFFPNQVFPKLQSKMSTLYLNQALSGMAALRLKFPTNVTDVAIHISSYFLTPSTYMILLRRCLQDGEIPNDLEESSLFMMILWEDGEYGQINYRVKKLLRYYADALDQKKPAQIATFRKLVSTLAKVIAMLDPKDDENSKKHLLADYFACQIKLVVHDLSDQKLWSELYLLEPDWLTVEVCRKMAPQLTNGLRPIAKAMESLTLGPTGDATMLVPALASIDLNSSVEQKQNESDGKIVKSKIVRRNQYGETPLHIACK